MGRIPMMFAVLGALAVPALALAQAQNARPSAPHVQAPTSAAPAQPNAVQAPQQPEPAEPREEVGEPAPRLDVRGFRARHDVRGEVTSMNKDSGMVTLSTPDGDMRLQFPPSALGGIQEGDHVEIELAIKPVPENAR